MNRWINSDVILGLAFGLIGCVLLVSCFQQAEGSFALAGDIPPFLVPQVFLTIWIVLSLAILVAGLRGPFVPTAGRDWATIVAIAVLLTAATLLLQPLGFMLVAPVAVFLTCWLLGFRRHLLNALGAVLGSGALHLVLTRVAALPLPRVPDFW
ncbi:hypothetical protein MesoLjLc_30980 [Mesorhizobium sp. L-8-10]|uniref:tripartite tricarboxylate transporter TctB family protein n=1 Tax=unclassified Mesorhizobium TaxID=325217 RepID=UPI0019290AEE|nr:MULTISPECIES: tripartite tricarboxylate transporter TctB family protein [unclassified Mesorhizobium]BCH23397.1 hypothetical protein MesoLjLb_31820 [Mesorhizobium sp. L-8-3]BCH31168.1 hypothetical protein MesoLjLc_30980 [Mesorhizobium sp. L-8-10]